MNNTRDPEHAELTSIHFGVLSHETIQDVAVLKVDNNELHNGNKPNKGSINDPLLGTYDPDQLCAYCKKPPKDCVGHPGRMEIPPVILPWGTSFLEKVLRMICIWCSKPLFDQNTFGDSKNKIKKSKQILKNYK